MPIYEYRCTKCGADFELIQKFSDPPVKKCRECGGKVEKLISRSAIQFKGSGWYVTDYARKSGGGEKGSRGSPTGGASSEAAGKTGSAGEGKKDKGSGKD